MKKLDEMFPREIVKELDKYIIGQNEAKKMIAIAIRNRSRRKMLPDSIREEVSPKNIMMIGPTGFMQLPLKWLTAHLFGNNLPKQTYHCLWKMSRHSFIFSIKKRSKIPSPP